MTAQIVPPEDQRRQELGAYLRSRRDRLLPADVGLGPGQRRRTPGLRREEVALLAGVGTTWYTWLEQGRDVRPSSEVLGALSDALRLDLAERRHLFLLAGRPVPDQRLPAVERVEEPLRRMLSSLGHQPAYVLGRRWDVLAWNAAATAVFGDYGALEDNERNVMLLIFTNPAHRRLLHEWEDVARAALGQFRADNAKYVGDPAFERLIAELMERSPDFRRWWPERQVMRRLSGLKHLKHPKVGTMVFEHMSFVVDDGSDMKLIVYTPLPQERTISKLARLLRVPPRRGNEPPHG